MALTSPIPRTTPIIGWVIEAGKRVWTGLISLEFDNWLRELTTRLNHTAEILAAVTLTGQGASIAATSLPLGITSAGLYRITAYVRITTPGTVSSSLTVTITTTDGGGTVNQSSVALTGNTTATVQ